MKKFHFISGLPRSGSTLLSAILSQNPDFYANITGPIGQFFAPLQTQMSSDYALPMTEAQKRAVLRGVFENFYDQHREQTIFDTNRLWCAKMPILSDLFPDARVIACVRKVAWIIDSLERLVQHNIFDVSKLYGTEMTVYGRAESVSSGSGMVGFALNAVREAYFGARSKNLVLLRYETLAARPAEAIRRLYELIGAPPFDHDFDDVEFDADEFDARLSTPGLHRVAKSVKAVPRQTVLPPDLFARYANDNFWENEESNVNGVAII